MKKAILTVAFAVSLASVQTSEAGDFTCYGKVSGVGKRYNPSTGSGFLALRAGPTSSATQVGELFEGDEVAIFTNKRGWLRVDSNRGSGWVHSKYVRSPCK